MTAVTVLYARRTRLLLAALTTTVPGDPPSGPDPSSTIRLSPPVTPAQALGGTSAPPPPPGPPRTLTISAADLAIVAVEAEFDDPLEAFEWQVVITTAPDGTTHYHLDRVAAAQIAAVVNSTNQLRLEVPPLGPAQLNFDVYNPAGQVGSSFLTFPPGSTTPAPAALSVPDISVLGNSPLVVLVEGYRLAVALDPGGIPTWP
jgi:hypothetical protein